MERNGPVCLAAEGVSWGLKGGQESRLEDPGVHSQIYSKTQHVAILAPATQTMYLLQTHPVSL